MFLIYIFAALFVLFSFENLILSLYCIEKKRRHVNISQPEKSVGKTDVVKKENRFKNTVNNFAAGYIRYKIIKLGRIPCHTFRIFILKKVFHMDIAPRVVIYGGFEIREPWNISIGSGTIIGDNSILDGRNNIEIGENVNFSTGVWLWTEQHDYNDPQFSTNNKGGKIVICNRAWISSRVSILPGITIGEGAVVAAGSVICKDCSEFGVYAGVPGKKIAIRNNSLTYRFDGKHMPFY